MDLTHVNIRSLLDNANEISSIKPNYIQDKVDVLGEFSFQLQILSGPMQQYNTEMINLKLLTIEFGETEKIFKIELSSKEDLFFRFVYM